MINPNSRTLPPNPDAKLYRIDRGPFHTPVLYQSEGLVIGTARQGAEGEKRRKFKKVSHFVSVEDPRLFGVTAEGKRTYLLSQETLGISKDDHGATTIACLTDNTDVYVRPQTGDDRTAYKMKKGDKEGVVSHNDGAVNYFNEFIIRPKKKPEVSILVSFNNSTDNFTVSTLDTTRELDGGLRIGNKALIRGRRNIRQALS